MSENYPICTSITSHFHDSHISKLYIILSNSVSESFKRAESDQGKIFDKMSVLLRVYNRTQNFHRLIQLFD